MSSVLFAVTTGCKLWIVKLANKRKSFLLDFLKENSVKESVDFLEGNIIAIQNFCPRRLII